jgi:hypothetical protein
MCGLSAFPKFRRAAVEGWRLSGTALISRGEQQLVEQKAYFGGLYFNNALIGVPWSVKPIGRPAGVGTI